MLTYDAKAVARLEKVYSTPQIIDQRRRLRAIVSRPGESGLDVGCGVAYLACQLAREVAPGGRIAAIDGSNEAVEASRTRIAKQELDGAVDVRLGDAADLAFADETSRPWCRAARGARTPRRPRFISRQARGRSGGATKYSRSSLRAARRAAKRQRAAKR